MKLTLGILFLAMTAGGASAQSPNILQNTKDKLNAAQEQRVKQENAALNGGQNSASKPAPAVKPAVKPVAQTSVPAPKPAAQSSASTAPASKPAAQASTKTAVHKPAPTKVSVAPITPQPKQGAQKTTKSAAHRQAKKAQDSKKEAANGPKPASTDSAAAEPTKEKKTITAEGRRDPFISPVVSRASGPNCSVGKRCLAIDQITVRGVVKAETGMIAVVVNSINKAYFLKENDPVYNGYVVKITGDSVVFKETVQDRLGKESTREVVKKITTPAV